MDAIQLGPLLLKKSVLVLLFSCLLAYLYIAIFLFKKPELLKAVEQHLLSAAVLWILIFKFSIILFRPSNIWTNPYGLLFFTGGTKGIYLASILTIIFFFWKLWRTKVHMKTIIAIIFPCISIILLSYYVIMDFM